MGELLSMCDGVVEMAMKAGADEAEAYAARGKETNVDIQKNDLQMAKTMSSDGIGIRVFRGGSLGFSYANIFDSATLADAVERALAIASAAPSDKHNGLPEPVDLQFLDGLYDVDAETFGVDRAVDMALEMLKSARGYDPRVSIDAGSLAVEYGTKAISTSKGIRASERSSLFFCLILGMAVDGDAVSSFDFQFDCAHALKEIDAVGTGKKLAENVVASLGAVRGESFRGSVILAPKAMAEVVSYPIESAVRAASVQKGTSKFCEKMGEQVASPLVSVCDDASLPNGFSTTSFDREGLAPTMTPLIERGILRNYLYDSYTARKDGRQSSGHARGGSRSVPSVGTTNVVYSAGDTSLADMISGTDKGILVTRYSGNVDPISGDFSGVVKGGRMIGGGALGEPLCGTMIAGNTFDLLTRVSSVSVERERLFNVVAPYVRIDDVTVTSG